MYSHHTVKLFVVTYYSDVIMNIMASQITGASIVFSTVFQAQIKEKDQSSAPLAFCEVDSPNAENVPIWWRHPGCWHLRDLKYTLLKHNYQKVAQMWK